MRHIVLVLVVLLSIGCSPTLKIGNSQPTVRVISNDIQLDNLLRNDFNFRYDFAQYAITQPIGWHYSNRFVGLNRFNRCNNYYSYTNRSQMWNDWVWGFSDCNSMAWSYSWNTNQWSSPYRWSPFGYDRWGYNTNYGWNNYYGWGNGYNNNTSYRNRRVDRVTKELKPNRVRVIKNPKIREINSIRTNVIQPKPIRTIRTPIRKSDVQPPIRRSTQPVNIRPTNIRPVRRTTPSSSVKPVKRNSKSNR